MKYKRYAKYSSCIFFVLGAWGILGSFKVPKSFGKTHFIVGYPVSCQTKKERQQVEPTHHETIGLRTILFSPDDDIQSYLIDLINHEAVCIKMAIFMLTTKEIIDALLKAHKRGVVVEIIIDTLCVHQSWSKINQLVKVGISLYEYKPGATQGRMNNLMHNKFIIFTSTTGNKPLVWTGSFNFTRSAQLHNQENVVVLDDAQAVEKFTQQFKRLKHRSQKL